MQHKNSFYLIFKVCGYLTDTIYPKAKEYKEINSKKHLYNSLAPAFE